MLAEAKVYAVHLLVRGLAEYAPKIAKSTNLKVLYGTNLQSAQDLDRYEGRYAESARHYFSVYHRSNKSSEKATALIGLSQELINCGSFRQARQFLKRSTGLTPELPAGERPLFLAQVEGKYGWVADYELGYWEEIKRFSNAQIILDRMPRESWGEIGKELYSTILHFSGRAKLGLADAGDSTAYMIDLAKMDFRRARLLDEKFDVPTINEKVGHGYAWEARCHLRMGDFNRADDLIGQAGVYFRKHKELFPNSSIMAHYFLLAGEYNLRKGWLWAAREGFEEAVEIRTSGKGEYSKGVADALAGIAVTYWKKGNYSTALKYYRQAFEANPLTLIKRALAFGVS